MKRIALLGSSVALAAVSGWAAAQDSSPETWHICTIGVGVSDEHLVITEPFAYAPTTHSRGMGQLNDSWQTYIRRVYRGTVDLGIDVKRMYGGHCAAGTQDRSGADTYFQNLRAKSPNAVIIPSPMDREGDLPRRDASAPPKKTAPVDSAAKKSPSDKAVQQAELAEPAQRAVEVDTPAGKILMTPANKAAYEAKLAEHQRQLAEREQAIADAAARHQAQREAAQAQLAKHEQALADHREQVARMERDAAAARAQWAQASGQAASPIPSTSPDREYTVRRVSSIGGGSSEEAARNNLLNGFHKQFGPITNIRCSSIIFAGKAEWTCSGDQAVRKVAPQSASGQ